ncbi:uroporphyrinogen decarboxylase family protein [Sporomusa sp.]|uniref:uroporphyrinogen decarboxylase family protein n=1 Tax=Sporomusa sp. TaxID=2078658 RepID=UPI002CD34A72|nr:uroporphyrinogen decarboxylase family protein [Sporomusa sp.]HWR45499.1 uroporphyrinogen decarboxylase family protein [Sporomusa sp.]
MKLPHELLGERTARIHTAVALGKPDRVPVVLTADAFCANHMGVKLSEFSVSPELSTQTMINSLLSLGEFDAIELTSIQAKIFSLVWLSDMKLAGRELPEGSVWQVDETGTMTTEDYDTILDKGYWPVAMDIVNNRLRDKMVMKDIKEFIDNGPKAAMAWVGKGILPFCPVIQTGPYEVLMGARTMPKFTRDIFKMPDKVEAVMKVMQAENKELIRGQIRAIKPLTVWISGARGASEFVSHKIFDRFVWPYIKEMVEMVVEEGAIAYLHFDSNWERDLEYFRQLPRGKCIFGTDSATNIYKVKEVLGDHMCIMGDVPPALLTLGTPDEVYNYCTKLINEIGPSGYILSQGCTIPPNANPENVKAMMAAAASK